MSVSDIIQVLVASASVAAVVVGIFAIIQAQIQARDALIESRSEAFANQKLAQGAINESRSHSLEILHTLNLPILAPRTPLQLRNNDLNWDAQHYTVSIKNVGTGVALNIWGVLLPPKKTETVDLPSHYCLRAHAPISQADKDIDTFFLLEEKKDFSDVMLEKQDGTSEKYSLCPPSPDLASDSGKYAYVARLTITYTDVFGRKHASIYDHTNQHRWKFVVHLDDICNDLEDLVLSKVNQPVISLPIEERGTEKLHSTIAEELPSLEAPLA